VNLGRLVYKSEFDFLGEIIKKEIGTIQLVILQRSEQLQIKMIEETERKLTIQRREEELH
jgi:hypothetical protein